MDAVSKAKSNLHIQMDGQLSALSSPSSAESRIHREEEQRARRILTSPSDSGHCGGVAWNGSHIASLANKTECRDGIKAGQGKLKGDGSCQGESVEGAGPRGCVDEGGSSVFTGREVMPLVILSEAAWNPSGSGKEQPFEEVLMKSQTAKPETSLGQLPHKDTVVPVQLPEMEPKLMQMASKSRTTQGNRAEAAGGRPDQADPASSDGPTEPVQSTHQAPICTESPTREAAESSSGEHQREGWRTNIEQGKERTGATGARGTWPVQKERASTSTEVKPSPEDHRETPKDSKSPSQESHRKGATPESQQSPSAPAEASQNQPRSAEKQGAWQGQNLQFKEAATMTTSTQWAPPPKSKCQDAEVQTTTDVCSRSTATSPLLFPASVCQHSCRLEEEDAEILSVLGPLDCGTFHVVCSEDFSSRSGRVSATDPQTFARCQVHVDPTHLPDHQRINQMVEKVQLEAGACQSAQASMFYTATSGPNCGMEATTDTGRSPLHSGFAPLQPVYQINIQPNRIPEIGICGKDSLPTTSPPRQSRLEHSNGNYMANLRGGPAPECLPSQEPPVPRDPIPSMKGSGSKKTKLQFVLENDQTMVSKNTKNTEHEADPHDSWAFGLDHDQETALSTPGALTQRPRSLEEEEEEQGEQGSSARKGSECEPVQDVVWDEQGMTWEVYGASLDPESLGFAIQSHLQSKIREQERKVRAIRKSICSESSQGKRGGRKSRNVFRFLLKSVRRPACCGQPRSSAVLD